MHWKTINMIKFPFYQVQIAWFFPPLESWCSHLLTIVLKWFKAHQNMKAAIERKPNNMAKVEQVDSLFFWKSLLNRYNLFFTSHFNKLTKLLSGKHKAWFEWEQTNLYSAFYSFLSILKTYQMFLNLITNWQLINCNLCFI